MDIYTIQKYLQQLGYYHGALDKKYGPLTKQAVRDFQSGTKLVADGICGPITSDLLGRYIKNGFKVGKVDFLYTRLSGKVEHYMIDEECNLAKNFKVREFMMDKDTCEKCGVDESERLKLILYEQLVVALQKERDYHNKPLIITSAYRNRQYNECRYIDGGQTSKHMSGQAADHIVKDVSIEAQKQAIRNNYKSWGFWEMEINTSTYVHADIYKSHNYLYEYES